MTHGLSPLAYWALHLASEDLTYASELDKYVEAHSTASGAEARLTEARRVIDELVRRGLLDVYKGQRGGPELRLVTNDALAALRSPLREAPVSYTEPGLMFVTTERGDVVYESMIHPSADQE
jgi:hypothetical protein